ncbi:MAG: GNAT family protein [Armatimonadota bacterium]|nr:GNAT family protein [Armatimonadota bacterium]MDR7549916.1 GNAT family protein [Armatimonadota bacterium]
MYVEPVVLEGTHVRLEPLSLDHHTELCEVGLDEDLLRWTEAYEPTPEGLRAYIEAALRLQAEGTALPFAVIGKAAGRAVGSTRYGNIDRAHRRVEIGWTWYGRPWQRTAVNTEAKWLLLRHAFAGLGCIRVEFKTDVLNERSRLALLRIGAREEGVLRKHMILPSGRIRDTVYYSIVDDEWPAVEARLRGLLHAWDQPLHGSDGGRHRLS